MDIKAMRSRVRARLLEQQQKPRGSWYEIRAAADDDTVVIRIYDEIDAWWGVSSESFARELALVTASNIEVQINSPGGDIFEGIAIYNTLRAHPAHITTRVDGLAASAASIIAQAGDTRVMLTSTTMMIHEAWSIVIGPAEEMRAAADLLDQLNDQAAELYAARAGGDAQEFRQLMADETWLTPDQAVELGLADEIVDPGSKATDDEADDQPAEAVAAAQLLEAVRSLFTDDDFRSEIGLAADSSAGERQEDTPAHPAAAVDHEHAQSLLTSLTPKGSPA